MTEDEATLVLDELAGAFPWWAPDERVVQSWTEAITESGGTFERAQRIARNWGRRQDKPPTLAALLAMITPAREVVALNPDAPLNVAPSVVRRVRAAYESKRREIEARVGPAARDELTGGHNHHGPALCPVCGGVRPTASRS